MSDVDTQYADTAPGHDHVHPPAPPARSGCERILRDVDERLRRRCARRVNLLSCRCTLCDGHDRFPILVAASDAPMLNTAYDGSGGRLTTGTDANWEVGQGDGSGPASVQSWTPATVVSNPSSAWVVSPYGNAGWISNAANAGDDACFRYRFNLGSGVDPARFRVDMKFYADNRVWEIYVNGVAQSTQPSGAAVLPQFSDPADTETYGFVDGKEVRITLDNHWRPCLNELVVHVKSPGGVMGFLAQNAIEAGAGENGCACRCECVEVQLPSIRPCISVAWGDTPCDCMETDDVEVLCITVCNCYSNVTFSDLVIGQIQVTDMAGRPVPVLPDGTPSIQVIPSGPICFGDVGPCVERDRPSCVSREVVLYTRGAAGRRYRLRFGAICFGVCHHLQAEQCFTFDLCQD